MVQAGDDSRQPRYGYGDDWRKALEKVKDSYVELASSLS